MPYTPPPGDQISFDFTVALWPLSFDFTVTAYTPPGGTAVHFDFTIVIPTPSVYIYNFEFGIEEEPPITKEMLLSLGIRFHGQVYKYWICQMSHGTQQVRRYSIPPDPKTLAQLELRSKWAAGVQAWHNLSGSDKLHWRRIGVRKKRPITSLNAWMSAWMRDKI